MVEIKRRQQQKPAPLAERKKEAAVSPLYHPGEASSLICELAEPIPAPLRERFFKRVSALLSGCDALSPGKISAACATAQRELLHAPEIDEPPRRPSKPQPANGPWRRRA
jgi:hypothetical protein